MTLIVYGSAGMGHKKAALALAEELEARGESSEVLDSLTLTPNLFSKFYTGIYWWAITYAPWLWKLGFLFTDLPWVHYASLLIEKHAGRGALRRFEKYLCQKNPKHIIFTHFLGIQSAIELRRRGLIQSSLRVVVTDFYAHAFWIYPPVDEFCVMAEETKQDMIRKWHVPAAKIRVTGIPISRKFQSVRRTKQERLALLFSSGSFGIGPTEQLLKSLEPLSSNIQAIVVSGQNEKMRLHLNAIRFPFPVVIMGLVSNMEELMAQSDVLVAKPGGITTCEALAMGLPMIISSVIPGQEEGNRDLLLRNDACWALRSPGELTQVIQNIIDHPEALEAKRKNIARLAKPNAAQSIV